ncbi:hypothetical protein L861_22405 [Litchfieldella anticariensis FP35 = DSM 16096]|uniref:VOC domain-containing protein n=1 Tax=Litchfieldella anticariensis (strain DSM 16096 / CECT 5854 / CIP 108499 / LMG 22089 / FP35) TaxID=1121939 RepID=S2L5R2_LITA3|nr:VOC family protein [Halomonas anticariensis]EPC03064.1 hypothetical protein L861_22405 [Halomonas anticariensis FP35 = DSM 16096]
MEFLVNLDVDDLERAIGFYTAAFGLEVGRRFGGDVAELVGGPTPLYLLAKHADTPAWKNAAQHRHYGRHWTPLHLDFVIDDIDMAVEAAVAAGAELEQPITTHEWGRLALMADPFGHGFCFVQFLGRGYDEIAD